MVNRKTLRVASVALFVCAAASQATAASVFYTDESTFLADAAAAGISLTTEGFEGEATTGESTSVSVPPLTASHALPDVSIVDRADFVSAGVRALKLGGANGENFLLSFAGGFNAIGFDFTDAGDGGATTIGAITDGGDSATLFSGFSAASGSVLFIGVINVAAPINSLQIRNTVANDAMGIDEPLQLGVAVPEPTTLPLMVVGLGAALTIRRRGRRHCLSQR